MGSLVRSVPSRIRWIIGFATLLLAVAAVPVLAEEPPVPPLEEVELSSPSLQAEGTELLPDAADVQAGIATVEQQEEARERELESPQAVREREESSDAFADVGVGAAEGLLGTYFGEQLAMLNADPARSISSAEDVTPIGAEAATVEEDGDSALLDAGIPVRTEDEDGEVRQVDLTLESTPTGFETANALSDVEIGDSAADPVELGEEGISITQLGADAGSASRRFGEQNVFNFESQTDTDTLVSPNAHGVEIFNLIRSEESPETFRFRIDLPAGAQLLSDGHGGAQVVRGSEKLAAIPFPTAVDAQGTDVPVDFGIEGDTIVLHVAHRSGDYAMPILLDPILEDWVNSYSNWQNGHNLHVLSNGAWQWASEPYGQIYFGTSCFYTCWGPGLYLTAPSKNYGANWYSHWAYSAPNIHSYISKVWLIPFWRDNHGCTQNAYQQPHDYNGLWDHLYNGGHWNMLQTNMANDVGHAVMESWGRALIIGLHSGGGINIPCWRDVYVGGAGIWLDDWNPPSVSASVSGVPTTWFNASKQITVGANTADEGLGVRLVTVTHEGKSLIGQENVGCTGLYGNRCPTTRSSQFKMTGASFGEGIRSSSVSVEDPTGKTATGGTFQTKVDYSAPEVILKGQLAKATGDDVSVAKGDEKTEKLQLPVYNLEIEAKDGSNTNLLTRRSGVKNIEIYIDGVKQTVPWTAQEATEDSKPMTKSHQIKLSTLTTSGTHKVEVKVPDQAENVRIRSIEFQYFPATGIKDEYVMHRFPLFSDQEAETEEEYHGPELAVNVMNGNLVYNEKDVEVEGPTLDLEVERYYNSMMPENEDTEWGDGWTLEQTPELDLVKAGGSSVYNRADVLEDSGVLEGDAALPTAAGATEFDPELRATLTKKASGGYELSDDTEQSSTTVSFDSTGQAEALLTDGRAKVDYSYEAGKLKEIEVEDPSTFKADPSELEIPKPQLVTQPTYGSSFGTNGAGDGQLKLPADIAIDSKGNLWVVDKENNRVQKFDANGKFLAKFGTTGAGDGQFNRPTGIAIAANGDLLVTDAGNSRVQRFTSAGVFISKFGAKGTGNGQFGGSGPEGIAIDAAGNIWVSDTYNGRVQKFTSAGVFTKVVGSYGTNPGQLGEPTGIDVDPSGKVWVADWQNNRITVYNNNGEYVAQYGSAGTGDGQFQNPDEIEIDKIGNVWVGDQTNHRVQQFDLSGQFKGKFGTYGSGAGQFSFSYPIGIAADSKGHLWISDVNNSRVQEWLVPVEKPTFVTSFGTNGSGDGQLKYPGDVAVGIDGNLWVVDKVNNRIQKFDPSGKFLMKFGSAGTGNGQFNRPAAIAVDRDGNLLVVDANNNRVQKFDQSGNFLTKFGSFGIGNGQFSEPEGIAADVEGNIWVSDTYNGRIQKFDETGKFIEVVGSPGTGSGQLGEPTGLDVDPDGNVWVADWANNRVSVFEEDGDFVGSFGTQGSGPGQFVNPDELDIDNKGNVWVGDRGNNRIQRFDLNGLFVGQFGSAGAGEGQFSFAYPMGIAADSNGRIFVADVNNHRVQSWKLGSYTTPTAPPIDLSDGDPSVEVKTEGGYVSKVEGSAAGTHTYTHVGDYLTAHEGPGGKTVYTKDLSGRLTKITLPNGTYASIAYLADNRVKTITIKLAAWASAKTTTIEYQDNSPRRTVVDPPDAPAVTYEIGDDGSVLKWWNSAQPPTIDFIAGALWDHREKDDDLWAGDHLLDVQAYSPEGIASIWVVTNGNELVHETNCEQTEAPGIECVNPPLVSEWVMNTEQYPPGHLPIEVIVTDHAEGTTTKRFWVDIPEPPPPPAPGTPIPPKFKEILDFRTEYGLEKVFPVANEIERNERIFNLINAWYQGDPVARSSWQKWGVPLRPADVAELEYRDRYVENNVEPIEAWAEANYPGTYAGYYLDHPAGGVFHVGFTQNQATRLTELKAQLALEAEDRMAVYPTQPSTPRVSLASAYETLDAALETNATFRSLVTEMSISESGNDLSVGTTNVPQTQAIVTELIGSQIPVKIYPQAEAVFTSGRYRTSGRMRAGDNILNAKGRCTAAFGASEDRNQKSNGEPITAHFVLTAGHCFALDEYVHRSDRADFEEPEDWAPVGQVTRRAFTSNPATDGEAIRTKIPDLVPRGIFGSDGNLVPTGAATKAKAGNTLCYSGVTLDGVSCGEVKYKTMLPAAGRRYGVYIVKFKKRVELGDSGGPVWNPRTGASIGVVSGYLPGTPLSFVTPLLHPKGLSNSRAPGILHHPDMGNMQLILGD